MVQYILLWNLSKMLVHNGSFCFVSSSKPIQLHPLHKVISRPNDLHALEICVPECQSFAIEYMDRRILARRRR